MGVLEIPTAPLVITYLITPMMEANMRRALLIGQGQWLSALFNSPLSIGLVIATVVLTAVSIKLKAAEKITGVRSTVAKDAES